MPAQDSKFRTTQWSAVLAARDPGSSRAQEALAELCQTYWYPLYACVRRHGNNPADAQDLSQTLVSRDAQDAEERYRFEPVEHMTPEVLFESRWALTVLDRVLARVRAESGASEKAGLFEALKGFLSLDQPAGAYAEVAVRTGLKEETVKVAVHPLSRGYGELLRQQVAETVQDPSDIVDEVRHFVAILSRSRRSFPAPTDRRHPPRCAPSC